MLMLLTIVSPALVSGETIVEDYTSSPQPDPDIAWIYDNFNAILTTNSFSFFEIAPIDCDESTGSVPYGYLPPLAYYDGNVQFGNYFDPNDPGWLLFPVPPNPSYPPFSMGGIPPYLPYPDDPAIVLPPDMYSASYLQSRWNIVNDADRLHYPQWEMQPFTYTIPGPPWAGLILPYSVTEVMKQFPRLAYTSPNFNYFGSDYDGMKFSMKLSSDYINDAVYLNTQAYLGNSPYDFYNASTGYPTVPDPDDWLELGHVSIIDSVTGQAGVTLGFVADLATGGFFITDSTYLNMNWSVQFNPGAPFPYINPSAPFPPSSGLITDVIANPGEIKSTGIVSSNFYYTSGVSTYDLGLIDVLSISSVLFETAGTIDPVNYTLNDMGLATDTITFATDPPVSDDGAKVLDGEMFTVDMVVPTSHAGSVAQFEADKWYQFEIRVNWNTMVDWDPTLELWAYDEEGFYLGSWPLDSFFDQWITYSQDTFYSQFAAPVPEGAFIPAIVSPKVLMGIEDIKTTSEIANLTRVPDWMEYIYSKTARAGWYPSYTPPSPARNRTSFVSFSTEYPPDTSMPFSSQPSDYGAHVLEMVDPANASNFIEIIMVAHPLYMTQTLDDISLGTIENVTMLAVVMDGDQNPSGTPKPSAFFPFAVSESYPTNISIEWDANNDYTCTFESVNVTQQLDTWSFSGNANWSDPGAEKAGGSDTFSYINDGQYGVTMNIHEIGISWGDKPGSPVLEDPVVTTKNGYSLIDVDWNDVPGASDYTLYWQKNGGTSTIVPVIDSNYTLNVTSNGNYSFWVEANNDTGTSDPSNVAWTFVTILIIGTTTSLEIDATTPNVTANAIDVTLDWSWFAGIESYNVYRSPDNVTFSNAGSTTISSFVDQVTGNGTWYYYVTGVNGTNEGGPSNIVNASITILLPGIPVVTVNATPSSTGIFTLRWNATVNTQRYLIYGNDTPTVELVPGNLIGNITATGIVDQQATNGTYYYVVIAVSPQGFTRASSTVAVVVAIEPPPRELTFLERILSFIINIIATIITFILSIFGLVTIYNLQKKRNRDCIGDHCNA